MGFKLQQTSRIISPLTVQIESRLQRVVKLAALISIKIIYGEGRALPFKDFAMADEIQHLPACYRAAQHNLLRTKSARNSNLLWLQVQD